MGSRSCLLFSAPNFRNIAKTVPIRTLFLAAEMMIKEVSGRVSKAVPRRGAGWSGVSSGIVRPRAISRAETVSRWDDYLDVFNQSLHTSREPVASVTWGSSLQRHWCTDFQRANRRPGSQAGNWELGRDKNNRREISSRKGDSDRDRWC